MPPVQAVAQAQAIGKLFRLTRYTMWDHGTQSPSTPPTVSTFPTMILPMMTSSMQHVQAVVQLQATGPKYPLTHQVVWGIQAQSLSIQTILCTYPTLIVPMTTSSIPPVRAVVHP